MVRALFPGGAVVTESNPLLEAALAYAARGWPVFPLRPRQKVPATRHGFRDASTDPEQIRQWWRRIPAANIGIPTGEKTFVAIDVDPAKGGADAFDALCDRHGGAPETIESQTGGGGRHLLFAPDPRVGNTTSRLGPGIDTRGRGGYIVVPPSIHSSGREYTWELSSSPDQVKLAQLPDWLVPPSGSPIPFLDTFGLRPPVDDAPVPVGERNDTLARLAGKWIRQGLHQDQVETLAREWNASNPSPLPDAEVVATCRSVGRTHARNAGVEPPPEKKSRLLSIDDMLALPPPAWLLDTVLPASGLSILYGPSGSAKSFLALDWALSIAAGISWFDRDVMAGPVVYVAAEGAAGYGVRLRSWLQSRLSAEARPEYPALFLPEPVELANPLSIEPFRREVSDRCGEPQLVVIDTVARCMVGDENSAQDVGAVIRGVDHLRAKLGCAVLLVHHTGKSGETERGSSALRAASDCMIRTTRDGPQITIDCDKQKDFEAFSPIRLSLAPVGLSCVLADRANSVDLRNARVTDALEILDAGDGVPGAQWRDYCLETGAVKTRSKFHEAVSALLRDGSIHQIGRRGSGRYSVRVPTSPRESKTNRDSRAQCSPARVPEDEKKSGLEIPSGDKDL